MKVEILNSSWYNGFTTNHNTSLKIRERRQDLMDNIYQIVAQNATPKNSINTAKINLAIKNISALFANINLHPMLIKKSVLANILLTPNAASLHFFITIMMITQIIVVPIRNAIIPSSKPSLP